MKKELTAYLLTETLKARSSIVARDSDGKVRIIGVNFTDYIKGHMLQQIFNLPEIDEKTTMILRTPYWGEAWDDIDYAIEDEFYETASKLDQEFASNLHHLRAEVGLYLPDISPFEIDIYSKEDNVEIFQQIIDRINELAVYRA